MRDLAGKTAVVTGGGTGYGMGIAEALVKAGMNVIITGRRPEPLQRTAAAIGARAVVADAGSAADWERIVELAGPDWEILVNNAGAGVRIAPLAEQSESEIAASVQTNLVGALYGCRCAARVMSGRRSGLIVNISSVCAHYGWPGWSVYTAAKAGVDRFSRALYTEVRESGVRVTVVTPSWGATAFNTAAGLPESGPEVEARVMTPQEMGEIVLFLAHMPAHLEVPELMVQPVVQEIVPF